MRYALAVCVAVAVAGSASAQAGTVTAQQKISSTDGGLPEGALADYDAFGSSVAALGDLNGDGSPDIAVGAPSYIGVPASRGSIWIVFLSADGTTLAAQEVGESTGGFSGTLPEFGLFGASVASIGDLNGDGVTDLAVGAPGDDDGGSDSGAVWILFLNPNGTVWANWKVSDQSGGFSGALDNDDRFGTSVAALGDFDGDGTEDLAVGAPGDDDGGGSDGGVWLLFMNSNGTVKDHAKISGLLSGENGRSLARVDDLNSDGVVDLAVGNSDNGLGGINVLLLGSDASVQSQYSIAISNPENVLPIVAGFASSIASVGDLDGDGVEDLAVGVTGTSFNRGEVWTLFLTPTGAVASYQSAGRAASMDEFDLLGSGVACVGDLNGDNIVDLAVGAQGNGDGGPDRGAVWNLFLDCSSANAVERKGSGINPGILYSSAPPFSGSTWTMDLNCIGHAPAASYLIVRSAPSSGPIVGAGEVLVGGPRLLTAILPHVGDVQHFNLTIPPDNTLCGLRVYCQGLCFGSPGPQLSNAVDVIVGH